MINKAFVLGAGLGTRLRPLTESCPKPLIPIFHKPLITFALDHLVSAGVGSFVINTHRLPDQFKDLFGSGQYAGHTVNLIHEPELLDTGGGIKNAEDLLGKEPFITYSGDVLTDLNLRSLIEEHFARGNDVTLGLRHTGLASAIAFHDGKVLDIAGQHGIPGTFDFANIAVWNSEVFSRVPGDRKISFIPVLAQWIGDKGKVGGTILNDGKWFNIGSAADYLHVHQRILTDRWKPAFVGEADWPVQIHHTAQVASDARLLGCTVIGSDCQVEAGAVLEDTIVWPGAQIASRSRLSHCIVRSHQVVNAVHNDSVV